MIVKCRYSRRLEIPRGVKGLHEGNNKAEEDHLSQSGSNMEDDMQPDTDLEPKCDTNLGLILRKKDGSSKLNSILEDIDTILTKMWKKQRSEATQLMCDPATEGCFIGACEGSDAN